MKQKITFLLCFLLVQLTATAQDLNALKIGADKIYKATITLDYDNILNYTYPKVFDLVAKEQMKEILKNTFNGNEQMKVKLIDMAPEFSYGDIKKIGDKTFCLVTHNLAMELVMVQTLSEEDGKMMADMMKESMETNDITFNKEKNAFMITKKATMIAIADASTKNEWRFLNKDKDNAIAKYIFDEKTLKELGL